MRAAVPQARLTVTGTGPLESLVRAADPDGVTVTIASGPDVVGAALRAATVVCTPSVIAADGDAESLLLVNLEAQATGRPVVTTSAGGTPEFVRDGETALVVPPGDADALADALVTLLRDGGLRRQLAAAGPPWAAAFDTAACARRIDEHVYGPLLGTAALPPSAT